jgi:curved DNA-binding protein CbpA
VNLSSKYFDSIRIAPRKQRGLEGTAEAREAMKARANQRPCDWDGCKGVGAHRAPVPGTRGQELNGREGSYKWFCAPHIREFNQNYNFFKDMSDAEVAKFQREGLTGHRPTWGLGVNAAPGYSQGFGPKSRRGGAAFRDSFGLFGDAAASGPDAPAPRRRAKPLQHQALQTLGLEDTASLNEIKSRYKELVKKHHPDANGGDRSAEERLRKVIQAYDYLRKSGFC